MLQSNQSNLIWKSLFFGTLAVLILVLIAPDNQREPEVLTIYTANGDIVYADVINHIITYESSDKKDFCEGFEEFNTKIQELTAESSVISGYAEDLRYQIEEGYITITIHPQIQKDGSVISPVGKLDINYSGPNWAINPEVDTSFTIATLNGVDEFDSEYDECLSCTYTTYVAYKID
jgi:hypothetical protein